MRTDELDKDTRQYVLEGVIIATTSPTQDETMNKIINSLKKDSSIRIAIQASKERRATILDDVMKMNREIDKRIVSQIRKKLYKTTCIKCVLTGG
jgi:methyl coenzyme M reductase beta subunit